MSSDPRTQSLSQTAAARGPNRTLFPIDATEWRQWSNIHPTLMRHGMPLFEMTDRQRDHAFAPLRFCAKV